MPGFDGTGPLGRGPYTGWGRGPCGAGMARGRSRIYGRGFGRSWSRWGYPSNYSGVDNRDEKGILEEELEGLKNEMEDIKNRLKELNKKK